MTNSQLRKLIEVLAPDDPRPERIVLSIHTNSPYLPVSQTILTLNETTGTYNKREITDSKYFE